MGVKVVGKKARDAVIKRVPLSVRIDERLVLELEKLEKETHVGKRQIIEGILRKVFADTRFVLNIDEL